MDPKDLRTIAEAALSFSQITEKLHAALAAVESDRLWVRDVYDAQVVYQTEPDPALSRPSRTVRRSYSITDEGVVTLGDPEPVAQVTSYVKVAEAVGHPTLMEASGDGSTFDVLAIAPGIGKNRRQYRREVLQEAVPLFDGARSFAPEGGDHGLGKRGPRELVGWFDQPRWYEGEHPITKQHVEGVAATYHVLESAGWLRSLLREALDAGKPDLIGFSIVGDGGQRVVREAGRKGGQAMDITRITAIESVDPVINPAQGGVALRLVASHEVSTVEWDKLTLAEAVKGLMAGEFTADELREHRADLVESIAKGQLAEAVPAPAPAPAPAAPAADDTVSRELTAFRVERALARRTGLAEAVQDRIRTLAEGRVLDAAGIDRLIESEVAYMAALNPAAVKETPVVTDMKGERDRIVEAVENILDGKSHDSIRDLYVSLTGDSGFTGRYQPGGRITESIVSGTFDDIFGDGMNRVMLREYAQLGLDTWRNIVDVVPVRDFKTQERLRWGGYGNLPTVAQGAAYTALSSPTEEKETYAISKRGGTEDLTIEAIANDDLGQMRRIPRKLARAAAQTLHEFVYDFIRTNATLGSDGVALFHASHANTDTDALAEASLAAGRLAIKQQTDLDNGKRLGLVPRFLLVPQELEQTAYELTQTDREVGSGNNTLNFIRTFGLSVIVVDYWTDATNWFLAADKSQVPTIEVGFLGGREEPELFLQDQPTVGAVFTNDRLTWKIRHIYGGGIMDYRGMFGAIVAG
jgi:hypothetical protein